MPLRPKISRKSPIGYPEYNYSQNKDYFLDPAWQVANAYTGFGDTPYSVYTDESFNNPITQTHERIHQGQLALGEDNNPKAEDIIHAVKQAMLNHVAQNHRDQVINQVNQEALADQINYIEHRNTGNNLGIELPAYTFSIADPSMQPAYNAYMNLLNKTSKGQGYLVGVNAPEDFQKSYIQNVPQQVFAPSIPMQSMGLIDAIKYVLGNKK